jgi:Molybdopterin-binding domain of aldehyde dehydrogenase
MKVSRRHFVKSTSAASAGLALGFHLRRFGEIGHRSQAAFEPNAYIRITSDNVVTLWVTRSEMGQGVRTNLPAALAEELDVELSAVQLAQAMPGARFARRRVLGPKWREWPCRKFPDLFGNLLRTSATVPRPEGRLRDVGRPPNPHADSSTG